MNNWLTLSELILNNKTRFYTQIRCIFVIVRGHKAFWIRILSKNISVVIPFCSLVVPYAQGWASLLTGSGKKEWWELFF